MNEASGKEWHPPSLIRIFVLMMFIIGANIFDGCSTLEILRRGGWETNPYACIAIANGHSSFLTWKIALITFIAAVIAGLAMRFRSASIFLHFLAFVFACLTLFHFYILGLS